MVPFILWYCTLSSDSLNIYFSTDIRAKSAWRRKPYRYILILMVCHFGWALTSLINKLLTQLSFPFWSFLSFLPAHQVHDLSWKMTGFCQYHLHLHLSLLDLTSSSFLSLQRAYISLIFNVPVFLQSFNSRYLYLVPTILLKLLWLRLQMTPAGLLLLGFCAASDTAGLFPALVFRGFPTLTTGLSKVLFFGLFPAYVFCLDNLSHLIPTIILPWHQWLPGPHLHWCLKSHSPALKPSEISSPGKGVLLFLYVEYELTILISTSCRSCQF